MTKRNPWANWTVAMVAASGLFAWTAYTTAATAGTLASTFQTGVNKIEDVSGEDYIPNANVGGGIGLNSPNGTYAANPSTTGTIAAGDVFLAVMDIQLNQSTSASYGLPAGQNPQLTGIFAVQVSSVTPNGTVSNGNALVPAVNLTFAPFSVLTAIGNCDAIGPVCYGATPLVLNAGATTAIGLHTDTTLNANLQPLTFGYVFSNTSYALAQGAGYTATTGAGTAGNPTQNTVLNQIASGNLEFSLDLGLGSGITADFFAEDSVPANVGDVVSGLAGTPIGQNASGSQISLFYQNTADLGRTFQQLQNGLTGGIAAPQNTIYGVNDDYTITLHAGPSLVPEPSSLALLGGGLVFLGGIFTRRRRRNEA